MKTARTNVQTPTNGLARGQTPPNISQNLSLQNSAAKKSQQVLRQQQEFLQAMVSRGSVSQQQKQSRNQNIKVAKTQNPADEIS